MINLILSLIGLWFLHYMMSYGQIEIIKFWRERNNMIKEMESVFHKLQESIITINPEGVSFINLYGKKILNDIHELKSKGKNSKLG